MKKIVPLIFHKIITGEVLNFEDVSIGNFLSIFCIKGINFKTIDSAFSYSEITEDIVCLTFDDGFSSDWDIVFPILLKNNATATFFVVTDWIGKEGYLTKSQIKKMSAAGMQIGSHSHTHPNFYDLDSYEVVREIRISQQCLKNIVGKDITAFSFPFGYENSNLIKLVFEEGYTFCCTSRHGIITRLMTSLPRNSINSTMSIKQISRIINANYLIRLSWKIEDVLKKVLKEYFFNLYIKIRPLFSRL
jgi:peptidoglycan/xylan/chitin deacetylase (PgdA/CDA1 family)